MGLLQLIDFGGEDVVEAASEIIIKCILCVCQAGSTIH